MKKLLLLILLPLAAYAGVPKYWIPTTQGLTRAAPTDGVPEGLNLSGVQGYRVSVCTASGATLTGGTLKAWVYNPKTALWERNPDDDLTITNVGTRCRTWKNKVNTTRLDAWVVYTSSSVTLSTGTVVLPRIDAWTFP